MSNLTLTIGNQSITFSQEDMPAIEAVLLNAGRKPGQEIVRMSSSGRIAATYKIAPFQNNEHASRAGTQHFNKSEAPRYILTDF
ncbi:hypothetical protein EAW52_05360 [Pseudomonas sp. LTJR-52]|uniref:hypothetical protein n=1 Tax=Pseudomonas sp. LTJR-52 TaxID=2479392 RepID=UPI000EFA3354|nr:hypothetical protein [Pseudomonas sp. LTJR-52]AYN93438.1 hypothetical protein EAW52_05360 [Pseudomonas sp. LTJR-52]